jgi:hypothetical protein
MKKILLLIIVLCLIHHIESLAQIYEATNWELNNAYSGDVAFIAYDNITLSAGFSYSADSGSFSASISEYMLDNADYIQRPDTSRELNTQLPVGTLPGSFDVSSTGPAIFSW